MELTNLSIQIRAAHTNLKYYASAAATARADYLFFAELGIKGIVTQDVVNEAERNMRESADRAEEAERKMVQLLRAI